MMHAEKGRRNGGFSFSNGSASGIRDANGFVTIPASSLASPSSSPTSGVNYIEHQVSNMDTLAGVAIKYGVEVADIRRLNGLVTDLQMFAHRSLHIPLPGRHPPSPIVSNGSTDNGEQTPPRLCLDVLDSFQSLKLKPPRQKVSRAMSSLQGYYGLAPHKKTQLTEGTVMAVYKSGKAYYLEDELMCRHSPVSDPLPGRHRKSRSLVNVILAENGEMNDVPEDGMDSERSIRRRQKTDAFPFMRTPEPPERLLKDDNSAGFSGGRGKSLAQRSKSGNRADADTVRQNAAPIADSVLADALAAVRKSSSTSNLQESENGGSIWISSKWSLKPDVLARPIFDGLPKPTSRRNKAALD